MKKLFFYLSAALALTCASCAGNKIYPVSGMVTYQGAPATGAAVFFYRTGGHSMNEHTIMAIVQEDGSFEVVCGPLGNGAPPGEYDVLIEWKHVSNQGKGRPQHLPDRLKGRYADTTHPLLHATVLAKTNNLPPFELTDAGSLVKR